MVDTVLYFEGDTHSSFRLVRAIKNRFGAVNEIGVFAMTEKGLKGVSNPSALFLSQHGMEVAGSCIMVTQEGTRPMLVEIQALVSTSSYGNARRMASGLDQNRLSLLLAVLEKRAGLNLVAEDVFVNVAGGIAVDEPAADLGIVAAVASSVRNRPIKASTAVFGEVGLAGEVRGISQAALRVREAAQMGFTRCIVPQGNCAPEDTPANCELVAVKNVSEALDALMEW
jgi:DNA repair protein RadA/Sms